ncbi:MAG: hypothetical protein HS126_22015 [Anaerolineales bacterium]|nr:hypothetical protein [Anaerolineales bacterium]
MGRRRFGVPEGVRCALPSEIVAAQGNARGPRNVLDILDGRQARPGQRPKWRQINAGDFTAMSFAGQFREENSEGIIKDPTTRQWAYPEGLANGYYREAQEYDTPTPNPNWEPLTPIVSKGTIYPLEARNFIAGNIYGREFSPGGVEIEYQWGSQKGMGKQVKRDELSLTRKYWQAGPALGVAYPEVPQHIIGQRATRPETAHIAKAFILDRGGIIPEGQMWKDTSYAPGSLVRSSRIRRNLNSASTPIIRTRKC